jgi:hypothetical protein
MRFLCRAANPAPTADGDAAAEGASRWPYLTKDQMLAEAQNGSLTYG